MTPIFTCGLAGLPEANLLGFGFLRLCRFLRFLFWFGLGSLAQFHSTGKKPGKKSAAQQRVPKELPGLRITGRSLGKRDNPSGQCFGIFRVLKWIEQPRSRVGYHIKYDRTQNAAANQLEPPGPRTKAGAQPNENGVNRIIDQLGPFEGVDVLDELII